VNLRSRGILEESFDFGVREVMTRKVIILELKKIRNKEIRGIFCAVTVCFVSNRVLRCYFLKMNL
jgi:hypothetical protein